MQSVVLYLSILLLLGVLAVYARNILFRTWDLLSWRNLFLLGFVHFYLLGAYFTAGGTTLPEFARLSTGGWAYLAISMVLFLLLFLLAAAWAIRRPLLTRLVPRIELPVTAPAVVVCSLLLMGTSLFFSLPFFNYFGLITAQIRGQLASCAVGLATYYLIARRFNPASWALFCGALFVALVASTVGTSGRRLMLGAVLAVPWVWYFTIWRYRGAASNFARIGAVAVAGVLAIIVYSPFRSADYGQEATKATLARRADQFVEILTNPKIDPKIIKYILYTDTVPNTMWVLDNYPRVHPFKPFQGAIWFVANPIPRFIWPGKPGAFGAVLRDQMRVAPNLGPGIIAHGWAEGWLIGVAGYAIFFGILVGIVDRALAERAWNPFFLAVMGSSLGNVIALPRGDTPMFLLQISAGIAGSSLFLYMIKTMAPIWGAFPTLVPPSTGTPAPEPDQAGGQDGWEAHPEAAAAASGNQG